MNHESYMKMALALAKKGRGFTAPNPLVGAVVVKNNTVIGQGWHKQYGGPHAEVFAIDQAGTDAHNATLYVTLEPCNHTGKTPPCSQKIIDAGITTVVMAMNDPNPVAEGGKERLEQHGITVISGVCEAEARQQNEIFIKNMQTDLPYVIVKYAATLDGRIATASGDSKWITGPQSRRFVHEIRHLVDGIMVGIQTVLADDPSLTTRIDGFEGKDPHRIIIDPDLLFPENAKMLHQQSESDTIIVCRKFSGTDPRAEKKCRLESQGVVMIEMDTGPEAQAARHDAVINNAHFDLAALMQRLSAKQIKSILIEGGSSLIASALNQRIVDKVFSFFAPKFLGGDDGIPICSGPGASTMQNAIMLDNIRVRRFEDDIMIEGYIK